MSKFVSTFMQQARLADEQVHNFEVSVDEHVSNLVEHAFQGDVRQTVTITCREEADKAQVIIADASAGFDPRTHNNIPDVGKQPISQIPTGGFGNYFICQLMDKVDYIHRPYVNNELILTVYKQGDG